MKSIKYSKYTGDDFGIDAQDLLQALSDFLLQSGFQSQHMQFSEWNEHRLEILKRAIQQALECVLIEGDASFIDGCGSHLLLPLAKVGGRCVE